MADDSGGDSGDPRSGRSPEDRRSGQRPPSSDASSGATDAPAGREPAVDDRQSRTGAASDRTRRDRDGRVLSGRFSPFSRPEGRRIVRTVVGTMVGTGLLVGVTSLLLGTVAGAELAVEPSTTLDAPERELIAGYQRKVYRSVQSYATIKVAQLLAVGVAAVLGVVVATTMAGDRRTKAVTTAMGSVIGGTGMVLLAGILATLELPTFAVPFEGGVFAVSLSVRVGQLATNALLVGLVAGGAGLGAVLLAGSASSSR